MNESGRELSTNATSQISFLQSNLFEKLLSQTTTSPDSAQEVTHCRFSFTARAATNTHVNVDDRGVLFFKPDQILDQLNRYQKMIELVRDLEKLNFTITRLDLVIGSGYAGTSMEFLTPSDRKQTLQYLRHDLDANMIPDDFLNDLGMFPIRLSLGTVK